MNFAGSCSGHHPRDEEYDQLVQLYYLARAQHQKEMLRMNQILYGHSNGGGIHQQQSSAAGNPNHRPALQGLNGNMQIDAHPHALESTRKRVHAGRVEEDCENKRIRSKYADK